MYSKYYAAFYLIFHFRAMNKLEQCDSDAQRNWRYSSQINIAKNKRGRKGNLDKVLSKIVANHDPLLSVERLERFIVENATEFDNVCGSAKCEEKSIASNISPKSVHELSSLDKGTYSPTSCNGAVVSLNVDDMSIVTPYQTIRQESPQNCTKDKRSWNKKRRTIEMEHATSLGEYVMHKYPKGGRQLKKHHFSSRQLLHIGKMRNSCYRKYLAVKYPQTINLNLHKYKSIRKSYMVNFPQKKKLDLSNAGQKKLHQIFKRWQRKNLPRIQHNSELLRELTYHWSAIREKHLQKHGVKLPDVTVSAVDIIATAIQVFIRNEIARIDR